MKKINKLIALILTVAAVLAIVVPVSAATIVNVGWVTVTLDHPGGTAPCIYKTTSATSSNVLVNLSGVNTVQIKMDLASTTWARCTYGGQTGYIPLNFINFTSSTFYSAAFNGTPLKIGYGGSAVTNLQKYLQLKGFYSGAIDGDFGSGTETALKNFQKWAKITQDGVAGPGTAKAILDSL